MDQETILEYDMFLVPEHTCAASVPFFPDGYAL